MDRSSRRDGWLSNANWHADIYAVQCRDMIDYSTSLEMYAGNTSILHYVSPTLYQTLD